MDRRRRAARTVALMSLFSMTDTRENVPVASFDGDGSDLISLIVGIEPVQAGSGDPSPTNVRPISGWTGATVTRTGKNLLSNNMVSPTTVNGITATKDQDGSLTLTGHGDGNVNPFFHLIGSLSPFPLLLKAGQYVLEQGVVLPTNNMLRISGASEIIAQCQDVSSISFTLTKDTYVSVYMRIDKSADFTTPVKVYPAIRIASEADTTYQAYSGETLSVTWQSAAGTVYGGTVDVVTGKLTVDRANIASYNGETLTGRWISDRDVYSAGTTPTIGAQVVYELATPIVYDLTPTQVTTLIGTNNIWADTGDIKYIEYNI